MSSPSDRPPLPDSAVQIARRLAQCRRPLLTAHIRLDGDAIGSELGLAHILRSLGSRPHIVNDSPIPHVYRFLPGAQDVGTSPDNLRNDYDLVVVLDTPTLSRSGGVAERLPAGLESLCIDHHPEVERFNGLRWLDTSASSVGEMIHRLARASEWPLPAEAATALYAAIITDTGRFSFPNTSPAALRAAADLIEAGAERIRVCEKVYADTPPNVMKLQAEVLRTLRLHAAGRIAVMSLAREMMSRHNVDPIDTQEFADYPRSVAGARVGVLLREMRGGKVKVSLRSRSGVNIEPVARAFGGGGHREASGCEVEGGMPAVEEMIVKAIEAQVALGEDTA